MNLTGKKILFIAPLFFGYEKLIERKLIQKGADVVFEAECKSVFYCKILNKISRKQAFWYQKNHYQNILKRLSNDFDYLFVIHGYQLSAEFILGFRSKNVKARCVMYQWDSEKANPYIHIKKYFDDVFTFDYADSINYEIDYLPLFFADSIYRNSNIPFNNRKIDFLFIASYRRERYEALLTFIPMLASYKFEYNLYISFWSYCLEYLKGYKINRKAVSFFSLSFDNYTSLLSNSKIVIDVTPNIQTGLPMRIIEAVGAKSKILTTNLNVMKEFGENSNVEILSNSIDVNRILTSRMNEHTNFWRYSLDSWIEKIFSSMKKEII